MQKLFLNAQSATLKANWPADPQSELKPVVKLFCPWGAATWLLTSIDPAEPDLAFGLCDLGLGSPELGYVSLSELREVRGPGGLYIERDAHWTAAFTLGEYHDAAHRAGRILSEEWQMRDLGFMAA